MAKKRKTIFETIRKPTAPPTQLFGEGRPEEKVYPSRRKAKHKKKDELV